MNDDKLDRWLIEAVLHLSHQVHRVERKIDVLLHNSQIDLSKEDKVVLETTKTVAEALAHLPHPDQTTNPKG